MEKNNLPFLLKFSLFMVLCFAMLFLNACKVKRLNTISYASDPRGLKDYYQDYFSIGVAVGAGVGVGIPPE